MALDESYVGIYKIYILKDPINNDIFYVGQTIQELNGRLSGHLSESRAINPAKRARIDLIINAGYKPIIEAVETIMGICYVDKLFVNNREISWVKYFKSNGEKLLNSLIMGDGAECKEYKEYVKSVQNKEGILKYYYAGKTYGGHEVYDEKKMNADGFQLPDQELPRIPAAPREIGVGWFKDPNPDYNPWSNPRFIEMLYGNGDFWSPDLPKETRYVACYKDTDPNYYDDDWDFFW